MRGMVVLLFVLVLGGCAHSQSQYYEYCGRWAARYEKQGTHYDLPAYREDLIATCMSLKKQAYNTKRQHRAEDRPSSNWFNPAVPEDKVVTTMGRDKAACIERSYIGQGTHADNESEFNAAQNPWDARGPRTGAKSNGEFDSRPVFDVDLFNACMNEAGWSQGDE